jgi:hypothetical protein
VKAGGSVDAEDGSLLSPILAATTTVGVSVDKARRWFLELEKYPDRYRFETHAGFRFTRGNFGEIGARFETRERFLGLGLSLTFELAEIGDTFFRFRLIRPGAPIWGRFATVEMHGRNVELRLELGGTTRLGACLLRLPPIKWAVEEQIRQEVAHIKASMEAISYYGGDEALPATSLA